MTMSEEKEALKKLIMIISDLRAKDEERYEAHVNFMNETIKMISAIESQMNKHWSTVIDTLKGLNDNINANLDSLLTGINPKGLRDTSKSLKEIMDTMNKSIQAMNLEKVLSELKGLKGVNISPMITQPLNVGQQPEQITADMNINPPPLNIAPPISSEKEGYKFTSTKKEEKKKKDEDEPHLIKPSDLFKK
jgi:hypothetical protein